MRSLLLAVTIDLLVAGCGSSSAPPVPSASRTATSTLTQPEDRFVNAIVKAIPGAPGYWSNATLVKAGYEACTALNADGATPESAVAAVRSDTIDDASARVLVRTAVEDLCSAASAAGLSPTVPASAIQGSGSSSVGVAQGKPVKYLYKVFGNYRATQLYYTVSNGDVVDLNHTNNVHTAGSALPWNGETTPESNGNSNVVSASTLSVMGDSYITCTITDNQGDVVATDTGRGAYASCYASTPN